MTYVLVLNASYEPLHVTTVKRAVVLLIKEKAEAIETGEAELRSETTSLPYPVVIRLIAYVRIPYGSRKRITRRAVFARDSYECQYCGSPSDLTIDHVVPRSKGGTHVWENIVACCASCNTRKGHGSPRDAGLRLRGKPTAPRQDLFVYVAAKVPPVAWRQYLRDRNADGGR